MRLNPFSKAPKDVVRIKGLPLMAKTKRLYINFLKSTVPFGRVIPVTDIASVSMTTSNAESQATRYGVDVHTHSEQEPITVAEFHSPDEARQAVDKIMGVISAPATRWLWRAGYLALAILVVDTTNTVMKNTQAMEIAAAAHQMPQIQVPAAIQIPQPQAAAPAAPAPQTAKAPADASSADAAVKNYFGK